MQKTSTDTETGYYVGTLKVDLRGCCSSLDISKVRERPESTLTTVESEYPGAYSMCFTVVRPSGEFNKKEMCAALKVKAMDELAHMMLKVTQIADFYVKIKADSHVRVKEDGNAEN